MIPLVVFVVGGWWIGGGLAILYFILRGLWGLLSQLANSIQREKPLPVKTPVKTKAITPKSQGFII